MRGRMTLFNRSEVISMQQIRPVSDLRNKITEITNEVVLPVRKVIH